MITVQLVAFSSPHCFLFAYKLNSSVVLVVISTHESYFLSSGYMAGKIFMSMAVARFNSEIAFSLVYIYAAELFPTPVR